jgi:hypothetical protein
LDRQQFSTCLVFNLSDRKPLMVNTLGTILMERAGGTCGVPVDSRYYQQFWKAGPEVWRRQKPRTLFPTVLTL